MKLPKHCLTKLQRIADRTLSAEESAEVRRDAEELLHKKLIEKFAEKGQMDEEIQRTIEEYDQYAKIKAKQFALQTLAEENRANDIFRGTYNSDYTPGEILDHKISDSTIDYPGSKDTLFFRQQAYEKELSTNLLSEIDEKNLRPYLKDKNIEREIYQLSYGDKNEVEVSTAAKELYKIYRKTQDAIYDRKQAVNGESIQKLEGYISSQHLVANKLMGGGNKLPLTRRFFDMFKKEGANVKEQYNSALEEFKRFVTPRLNHDATFEEIPEEKRERFLDLVFRNMVTENHARLETSEDGEKVEISEDQAVKELFEMKKHYRNMGDKQAAHRVLIWKNGDAAFEVQQKYGMDNLLQSVAKDIQVAANQVALMKMFGPLPEEGFINTINYANQLMKKSFDAETTPKFLQKQEKLGIQKMTRKNRNGIKRASRNFQYLLGQHNSSVLPMFGKIMQSTRSIISMNRMSMVAFRSFDDLTRVFKMLQENGTKPGEAYPLIFKSIVRSVSPENRKSIAKALKTILNNEYMGSLVREGWENPRSGNFARAQQFFYKINGAQYWDQTVRNVGSDALAQIMASQSSKTFSELPEQFGKQLSYFNISEKDWEILRVSGEKANDGNNYITVDSVDQVPKEIIINKLGLNKKSKIVNQQIKQYRQELRDKLAMYYSEQTNLCQIPTLNERYKGSAGDPISELVWTISQFKHFAIINMRQVVIPAFRQKEWGQLGYYFMNSSVLNLLSNQLILALSGYTAQDMTSPKTYIDAMVSSFAYPGMVIGAALQENPDRLKRLLSDTPATQLAGDVGGLFGIFFRRMTSDDKKDTNLKSKVMKVIMELYPNTIYTYWAIRYFGMYPILGRQIVENISKAKQKSQGSSIRGV